MEATHMRHAKYRTRTEQLKFWLLAWVSIAESMVTVFSLGFLSVDWYAPVLFSDWMDEV